MTKKSNKRIILITSSFPYDCGEQFLETEIKYWQQKPLSLMPLKTGKDKRSTGDIDVDNSLANNIGKFRKFSFFHAIQTFLSMDLCNELLKQPSILLSKNKLITLFRFVYMANRLQSAIIKSIHFDKNTEYIFYTYWLSWSAYGLTKLKKKFKNIKIISRAHRADLYRYAQIENYVPLNKSFAAQLDHIFSISDDGKEHLMEEYQLKKDLIDVSRLGVLPQEKLNKQSETPDSVHFLSVSYVKPVKRVDLLANMLIKYAHLHPKIKVKWTHLGGGIGLSKLQKLVKNTNIEIYIPGMVDNKDVYAYYKQHKIDIFYNVSTSEGIPVSIMEAISFGVSIVATDVGGTKEIVDTKVGELLPIDFDYMQFEQSTNKALNKVSSEVISYFDEQYNAEINYQDFIAKIQAL